MPSFPLLLPDRSFRSLQGLLARSTAGAFLMCFTGVILAGAWQGRGSLLLPFVLSFCFGAETERLPVPCGILPVLPP